MRPRYGRIVAFATSVLVTGVALLGGAGVLPSGGRPAAAAPDSGSEGAITLAGARSSGAPVTHPGLSAFDDPAAVSTDTAAPTALPADSGTGRRVVFDIGDQRVWLVRGDDAVARTYPVSGSIYDNLEPGTYQVYSRSRHAVGVDDSGTMQYMVRFAHGANAAIGFHDIPVLDGDLVQTRDQLGTPLSHGCVRQWRPDAKALWRFADLGTTVVVTA